MENPLFRQPALEHKARPSLGKIRLATPISLRAWILSAVFSGAAIVAWLLLGHYTRREHASGILVPTAGLIEITARTPGTVATVSVVEGQVVRAGDILVTLSSERTSEIYGETGAIVSSELHNQQRQLQADLSDSTKLADHQASGMRAQLQTLQRQLDQIDAQLDIVRHQVDNYEVLLDKIRPLEKKGYVSTFQVQQQESQVLDANAQSKGLRRQRYEILQQWNGLRSQLDQLPLATEAKRNDLRRQLAQNQQMLAQNEADRSVVLRAPRDGSVSALIAKRGQAVAAGQILLAILPRDSPLQAQLLVPSRAIGFVRQGTAVALHYQAFPYQKFGVQRGAVQQISRSALTPSEVTELLGQQPPTEPLYRIQVTIPSQFVTAYGRREQLKPGMAVDADLLLDRRRLVEWLFEPLYGMQRRAEVES